MKATKEVMRPDSCLNKAIANDETVFVLRAKDPAAQSTIAHWAGYRVLHGLNKPGDQQILDALTCGLMMEKERKEKRKQ